MDRLEELLKTWIEIKIIGRIGPGAAGPQQGRSLNVNIEWRQFPGPRFVWYADCRHVSNLLKVVRLPEDTKPMPSPGTKATGGTLDNPKELSADEKKMIPKAGGILIYLGQDVPQIQFAAKAVMQDAAKPTGVTVARLKRVGRYLLGNWITELH